MDGSSFSTWTQFRKCPFASYITTQSPPKMFKELQRIFTTTNADTRNPSLIDFDQDTGLLIPRLTADIYLQALHSV